MSQASESYTALRVCSRYIDVRKNKRVDLDRGRLGSIVDIPSEGMPWYVISAYASECRRR